jgi:superfamily II DNA or RNA helicase
MGEEIVDAFPDESVGLYAGSGKSGIWESGQFLKKEREEIKRKVREGQLKILVGTDAASEGLNLQALGTLINIDLPWNPTRLEQRKGRIQRIGQAKEVIRVLNLRYKDSVEENVHEALSDRLEQIHNLFGQVPDILKNVWIEVALDNMQEAERLIEDMPRINPFDNRYSQISAIPGWDTWNEVLNRKDKLDELRKGWGE